MLSAPALALPNAEQQLDRLMDRLWQELRQRFPELAERPDAAAAPGAFAGRLSDWSRQGRAEWGNWANTAVRRIEAIDATVLPQAAAINRATLLDHFGRIASLIARYRSGAAAAEADAAVVPYAISPASGPHLAVPALLLRDTPLTSRAAAEAWLARLAGFAPALDAATAAFVADSAHGIVPSAWAVQSTLRQLAALRQPAPAAHPLVRQFAARAAAAGLADSLSNRAAALIDRQVYPALDRQIAALAAARPPAGMAAGAWTLPGGGAFYADALGWHTRTTLSAAGLHRLGLDQIEQLQDEMDGLLAGLGLGRGSVGERLGALAQRPDEVFAPTAMGRAAVLSAVSGAIEDARPHLAALFPVADLAPLAVQPLPASLAGQRTEACLLGGRIAGTQAGTVYVNLQDLRAWPRFCVASTAFHGALPAHLWSLASTQAGACLPEIRLCGIPYAACADGWSLYAGQVADEQGLYAGDPASRLGHLRTRLIHAARMVADTGVNAQGWSITQAACWLTATTGLDPAVARSDVELMALLPGKACTHAAGQAEWLRLRSLAQRLAGPRFDQRRFHQVIRHGPAPFAVLEDIVIDTFTPRRSVLVTRRV